MKGSRQECESNVNNVSVTVLSCSKIADTKSLKKAVERKRCGRSSPSGKKGQRACKNYLEGTCTNPSCDYWHPPVCQNYKTESGCNFGDKCPSRHTEVDRQPSKKSKKSGGKRSVASLTESKHLGCLFQDTEPPKSKSILRKSTISLGSDRTVRFSKDTLHPVKFRERNGPSPRVILKCEPQERNPCAS